MSGHYYSFVRVEIKPTLRYSLKIKANFHKKKKKIRVGKLWIRDFFESTKPRVLSMITMDHLQVILERMNKNETKRFS